MDLLPALGLLALLLVKEAGVPIPVPGDLLVIGAGVAAGAAGGGWPALVLLAAILVAGYVGGTIQFLLVRGTLRRAIVGILRRAGVSEARLDGLAAWLRRRGAVGVATARATPAVRVGAIAASGLAGLALPPFVGGLVVGNGVFVAAHFALGLVLGPPAVAAVAGSTGPIAGVAAFVVLAGVGWLGWRRFRASRRAAATDEPSGDPAALPSLGAGAWVDAACPACLAISFVT